MSNLDDFFKKKDVKKSKGKKSGTTQTNNSSEKEKSTQSSKSTLGKKSVLADEAGDEWKDVKEEEKKDYSGLKIQNLQISDDSINKENNKTVVQENDTINKKQNGPWNRVEEPAKPTPPEPEIIPEPEKQPAVESKTNSTYVPPQKRSSGSSSAFEVKSSARTNPVAKQNLDVSSKTMFPSLNA